mmetsp:Transcript_93488/g.292418  ORF Transcript_93488/g.292418 Transcript_93488/m.292418 type:complete len:144 (-) Transcript_93488:249-680(-)
MVQSEAPPGAAVPGLHSEQTDEPAVPETRPAAQARHRVCPGLGWCSPSEQALQRLLPPALWYVPGAHPPHSREPRRLALLPGAQSSQNSVPFGWLVAKLPAGHATQLCDPSSKNWPCRQLRELGSQSRHASSFRRIQSQAIFW